ncbi:MAG: pyridoxal phosphate-dependent decarboxylase family protein [Acidimicrobiales bacterium]
MGPEEFRHCGHELIDWIADYRTTVGSLPVRSAATPGEVVSALPSSPPEMPEPFGAVLADLDATILPGLTHTQHPANFAWFPANATLSSVLGDIAASGIGALGITWQSAPALTELEEVVCDWMRQLTGLSERWQGTILDGASSACLVALLVARERASGASQRRGGLQAAAAPLTVYCSAEAHSSVTKAALLSGYGAANLRLVPVCSPRGEMDTGELERLLSADETAGLRPAAVVATAGTTAATAFDPLGQVARIAHDHGAFVHVDAAMAGGAMLLPEKRGLFEGIEEADSLCWNPHKWMGSVLETSLFYVKDPAELVGVMATDPSYLRSAVDGTVVQYRDWGIPLGRRFRALKIWFQLRLDGAEAIRVRMRRDLANARRLVEVVERAPAWTVLAPVELQTVCVRHEPRGLSRTGLDEHTRRWCEAVNASGLAHLTPALLDGQYMVRISIGAEATEWTDIEALWELMQKEARTACSGAAS